LNIVFVINFLAISDSLPLVSVLYSHGNAEDLSMVCNWLLNDFCPAYKVNAISYDFSGYGESSGKPTESNIFADIEIVYRFAREQLHVAPQNLVLVGCSLGTAPSIYLAAQLATTGLHDVTRPAPTSPQSLAYLAMPDSDSLQVQPVKAPQSKLRKYSSEEEEIFVSQTSGSIYGGEGELLRGLVLISPLLSALRVAYNWRWSMPGDVLCSVDRMHLVRTTTLILHGQIDEIVPFWHGLELFQLCSVAVPPVWLPRAAHNDVLQFKESAEALRHFIHNVEINAHAATSSAQSSVFEPLDLNIDSSMTVSLQVPVKTSIDSGLISSQNMSLDWRNWDGVPRRHLP
jgi:pimeloyl-ACP methyl ester carboxylesterase